MAASIARLVRWIDGERPVATGDPARDRRVDWVRCLPFLALHLGVAGVLLAGASPVAVAVAAGLYLVRMFAITGFYHRYFSHRAFRTSRAFQLLMAFLGASSGQ